MSRLSILVIAVLPLALGATMAAAQEAGRPAPGRAQAAPQRMPAPAQQDGPREYRVPGSLVRRQRPAEPEPARRSERQEHDSVSDAVRRVHKTTGGQILGAERVPYDGGNITRVKYLDDRGRVRYMDDPGAPERRAPRRSDNGEP